jgi:hypothetical protein
MTPRISIPIVDLSDKWFHPWIYYLAAGLLFAATVLRSMLVFRDSPDFRLVMLVLAAGLVLLHLFLFIDGEESGWLGAYAYLMVHPQGKNEVGVVLCFDARPGNAPLVLQQTSPGDAWLVRQMNRLGEADG